MTLTYVRAFPTELELGDRSERSPARLLTGRLVPYNVVADVLDELPGGKYDIYQEGFRPGAFSPQANTGERGVFAKIQFVHTHTGGLGYLGPFTSLRDKPDGLWGDVAILPTMADNVAALLDAGVNELSVEFRLTKPKNGGPNTEIDGDGVRWRTNAHLDRVALEAKGAYSTAQVLAYRSEVEDEKREQAEAEAAEAKAAADEAEAKQRADDELEVIAERRRRWAELTGRLDSDMERQAKYIREYGITKIGQGPRRTLLSDTEPDG